MNIIEFETRTNVAVSAEEYAHIEAVYMASDLDKDEFCAMWRKMNRSRVNAAIAAKRDKKTRDEIISHFMFDAEFNRDFLVENYERLAINVLSDKSIDILERAGIETLQKCHELIHAIRDYIAAA